MRIKESIFSRRSKLLLYSLATVALFGCGGGDGDNSLQKPTVDDELVQVIARDALFSTELAQDDFVVELYDIVLKENSGDAFKLIGVTAINSDDRECNVTSISQYSFSVPRKQARVCDYQYQIASPSEVVSNAANISPQSGSSLNSAMVRVVVSNANSTELPPLSSVALVNESNNGNPEYVYQPVLINLFDELQKQGVDVSNMTLGGAVSQPFNNKSTVDVDVSNDVITYTPAAGFTGLDRLMYSYTDSVNAIAYSGTIDIIVSDNANQGIIITHPDINYDPAGKGFVPLKDALGGIEVDVSNYVMSLDGDDLQLIYVHSMSAPQSRIESSNASNPTNMKFTFKTSVQREHVVTYVVSDKKGAYAIGHMTITVLDEGAFPPWKDITHKTSGTLFFAPKGINELVANSYLFTDLFNVSQSGSNYLVGRLDSTDLFHYCELLGAEIATAAELKSLVDRGWTASSEWPTATDYLVKESLSSSAYKLIDISSSPYAIDITKLNDPTSVSTSYFPACVVRGKPMLTSLALSATPPAGSTSLVVPQGFDIVVNLSGYFNDGSHESDMMAYDKLLTSYVQSPAIFEVKDNQLTGQVVGTTDVYGQYDTSNDPLRSNKLSMEVTSAIATNGTLNVSSNSVPLGAEVILTGEINFSDGTKKQLHEARSSITWVDSQTGNELTSSSLVTVSCDASACKAKANSSITGDIKITWRSGYISAPAQTITVNAAALLSLDSITATDAVNDVITNTYPVGRRFRLTVLATYSNGTREVSTDSSASWTFSNAHFTRAGNIFTGRQVQNSSTITFKLGAKSIAKDIKLSNAYITGVEITESSVSRPKGMSYDLNSKVFYSDGTHVAAESISGCTWKIGKPDIANVDQSGRVFASSINTGNTNVILECRNLYNDTYSDSASFTVTDAIATSITVSAVSGTTTARNEKLAFKAVARMSDGITRDVTDRAAWSLSNAYSDVSVNKGVVYTPMKHTTYGFLNPTVSASLDGVTHGIKYTVDSSILFGNKYYWLVPKKGRYWDVQDYCDANLGYERPTHNDIVYLSSFGTNDSWINAFPDLSRYIWQFWRGSNTAYTTNIETGKQSYDSANNTYTITCVKK
ncbi:hypothetical protein [Vibrio parahaemolyticus]